MPFIKPKCTNHISKEIGGAFDQRTIRMAKGHKSIKCTLKKSIFAHTICYLTEVPLIYVYQMYETLIYETEFYQPISETKLYIIESANNTHFAFVT